MPDFNSGTGDFSIPKALAAMLGAFVSLRFLQGTWVEKLILAIGGAALSYFATDYVVFKLQMQNAEGLVGFMLGLFGMAIVAKVWEVIQLWDAKQLAGDLWELLKRKWNA